MRRHLLSAILAAGVMTLPAMAQAPRDDRPENPQPGEPPRQPHERLEGRPGIDRPLRVELEVRPELVRAPYLGVTTSQAPKALRHQVELPNGVGLVIDSVVPESPAFSAGLRQHDLLHKLDDQLLVNPQQLAVLVRTYKPGDSVKLTVIRAGKPVELTARLIERDLPPLDDLRLGVEPRAIEDQLRWAASPALPKPFIIPMPEGAGIPGRLVDENFAVTWDDGTITMAVKSENGKRSLVATDKEGKELYNGPIDTDEQREKLPPEVRERLKNFGLPRTPRDPNRRESDRRPEGERKPQSRPEGN